jgi:hypothetical protein
MITIALAAAGCTASDGPRYAAQTNTNTKTAPAAPPAAAGGPQKAANPPGHDGHDHAADTHGIPAFETSEAGLKNLAPTLSPSMFTGKVRQAYQATREIPQTIAQLPCYCRCDKGFGHKSLHSCYVDDHASHCAVCVDEVLLAYRLHKEEKLKPEQIRELIIAEYSGQGY